MMGSGVTGYLIDKPRTCAVVLTSAESSLPPTRAQITPRDVPGCNEPSWLLSTLESLAGP